MICGTPQWYIIDPLLFNVDTCHLIVSEYSCEFAGFPDDTNIYGCVGADPTLSLEF